MSEKFCPTCKYKNEASATICVYCGASLDNQEDDLSTTKNVDMKTSALHDIPEEIRTRLFEPPRHGIALYMIDSDKPIILYGQDQFVLGRKMTGEMDDSFVDLRQFGADENGVSRRHAMIRRIESGYEIIDLGSTNGTWLEKQRIVPNRPYPLNSGTVIFLGRLQLLVVYQVLTG
jgi:hypothetical protein